MVVDNYDISLLQFLLLWKNAVNLKEFGKQKKAIRRIDGCNWRRISSISLKTETITSAYLKESQSPSKYWSLQVAFWNNGSTTQLYGCICFFEVTISLKQKYLSNTLYMHNSWLQVPFWNKYSLLRSGWPQIILWNKETLHSGDFVKH